MGLQFLPSKMVERIIPALTVKNWSGFTNQPDGDAVEILSSDALDVGLCTIWGTVKTTGEFKGETVTLTGTDVVTTVENDWDDIVGVFLGDKNGDNITRAVGTITVREASANGEITTITATYFHSGMITLELRGLEAEIALSSGTVYWNTLEVATELNGAKRAADIETVFRIQTDDYLWVIANNNGADICILVFHDV
jgi:hypothetical protein